MADIIPHIKSLLAAANKVTGKSDNDLTVATQSLIDGFGGGVPGVDISDVVLSQEFTNSFQFRKYLETIANPDAKTVFFYNDASYRDPVSVEENEGAYVTFIVGIGDDLSGAVGRYNGGKLVNTVIGPQYDFIIHSGDVWKQIAVLPGVAPPQKYTVEQTLVLCESDFSGAEVTGGEPLVIKLTALPGYTMDGATVSVQMGGADITPDVYSGGTISVHSVTGNVVISATAVKSTPFQDVEWRDTAYAVGNNGVARYNGWIPGNAVLDKTRNKIVLMQPHSPSHSGPSQPTTICTINPYNVMERTDIPEFPGKQGGIGGLIAENGVWTVYGSKYRYRSSDGGATWDTATVTTPPARFYGVSKVDGVLYAGDDFNPADPAHNGWYAESHDDGITWEQKVFDFADQYKLPCCEASFCKWKGELYAALRRETEPGILAKQVNGVWQVVTDQLPNVGSDTSLAPYEDAIAMASIDRPNVKLILSVWDGVSVRRVKEYDFKGLTSPGDFHTPTYVWGGDFQAVFFMTAGFAGNEYQSAMTAAVVGYKSGVIAVTPTYVTEKTTKTAYNWKFILPKPYANASVLNITDSGVEYKPIEKDRWAYINTSERSASFATFDPDGTVYENAFVKGVNSGGIYPRTSASAFVDTIRGNDGKQYVCVPELNADVGFDPDVRGTLTVKIMGIANRQKAEYSLVPDGSGVRNLSVLKGFDVTMNASLAAYRVKEIVGTKLTK